jgi:hypothetical protein
MSNFYAEAPEHGGYSGFVGADHVTLKLINDTFRDDSVTTSGTIYAHGGSVTIDKCSFSHDESQQKSAGAAYVLDGKLTIDNSTFSDDSTADFGGAVKSVHSPTTITDSTFTGNSAYGGGALYLTDSKTTITAATIIGNHALTTYGGGIAVDGGTLTLANTIVAGNTETNHANADKTLGNYSDVWVRNGATLVANFSLIQHNPGDFDPAPGTPSLNSTDILDKSADLGPLAFNGGPTETELPKPGSPAINAGQAFGLKTDQRGDKRTVDYPGVKKRKGSDGTDIGAVELQAPKHS